jgi:hypothetical protein
MSGRLSFICGRQARQLSKTPISLKTLALAVNERYGDVTPAMREESLVVRGNDINNQRFTVKFTLRQSTAGLHRFS